MLLHIWSGKLPENTKIFFGVQLMVGLLRVFGFVWRVFFFFFSLVFLWAVAVVTSFFPQDVLSVEYFFK